LKLSERGYEKEEVERAVKILKDFGIEAGIQIMPGLPGSSFENDLWTVDRVIEMKPSFARVYPTLVINDTKLEKMYKDGSFEPLTIDKATELCSIIIAKLELNDIKIIRVGLQPSDDIREDGVIIAGPFHSAFRELCESYFYKKFFQNFLKTNEKIIIEVSNRDVSRVCGIKSSNREFFGKKLEIVVNPESEKGIFILNGQKYERKDLLKNILSVV